MTHHDQKILTMLADASSSQVQQNNKLNHDC